MNPLKQLAGQTAVYGLGTIIPRLLNYLLVPFYTRLLMRSEYGTVTELYAYIAFFFVLLLYGMETTFFRYADSEKKSDKVFSTSLIMIFSTSLGFVLLVWIFLGHIADALQYPGHRDYIILAAVIVALDAFSAIQFAHLRQQNKALKFSVIKIIIVAVNIFLNVYFIWFCDLIYKNNPGSPFLIFYQPQYKVEYILISNLVASLVGILLLIPQITQLSFQFDRKLLKRMLIYTFPLLIVGVAGMINEVSDKIIFKYLVRIPEGVQNTEKYILSELGVYGANYKLAVLMTIFIQMFRYAAEPFFFAQSRESNAKQVYADVMKYFVIFGLLIFLGITLYIDVFKYFLGKEYWEALNIVPIVLVANLLLGIFYNLSIWYKLNDLTRFGAYIAITGSVVTILSNVLLVPPFSYVGAAWAHIICYVVMILTSYYLGRKYYPIHYDLKRIFFYMTSAIVIFLLVHWLGENSKVIRLSLGTFTFLIFLGMVYYFEKSNFIKKSV